MRSCAAFETIQAYFARITHTYVRRGLRAQSRTIPFSSSALRMGIPLIVRGRQWAALFPELQLLIPRAWRVPCTPMAWLDEKGTTSDPGHDRHIHCEPMRRRARAYGSILGCSAIDRVSTPMSRPQLRETIGVGSPLSSRPGARRLIREARVAHRTRSTLWRGGSAGGASSTACVTDCAAADVGRLRARHGAARRARRVHRLAADGCSSRTSTWSRSANGVRARLGARPDHSCSRGDGRAGDDGGGALRLPRHGRDGAVRPALAHYAKGLELVGPRLLRL